MQVKHWHEKCHLRMQMQNLYFGHSVSLPFSFCQRDAKQRRLSSVNSSGSTFQTASRTGKCNNIRSGTSYPGVSKGLVLRTFRSLSASRHFPPFPVPYTSLSHVIASWFDNAWSRDRDSSECAYPQKMGEYWLHGWALVQCYTWLSLWQLWHYTFFLSHCDALGNKRIVTLPCYPSVATALLQQRSVECF